MALVGVIMGSISDYDVMKEACEVLESFGVPYEKKVVSAHRTPELLYSYARKPRRGTEGDHSRCRRSSAPSGYGGIEHHPSGGWRSGKKPSS